MIRCSNCESGMREAKETTENRPKRLWSDW